MIRRKSFRKIQSRPESKAKTGYGRTSYEALITALENEIAKLPKLVVAQKMCDFMRGTIKEKLIEQRSVAIDVAVKNYGYSGSTVACVHKYMHESNVGTQLTYNKNGAGGMYMIFVTN